MVVFGLVSYAAFFKLQSALDDICKNRFKRYQAAANLVVALGEIQAKMQETMTAAKNMQEEAARTIGKDGQATASGQPGKGAEFIKTMVTSTTQELFTTVTDIR